jgi:hypothetical protein
VHISFSETGIKEMVVELEAEAAIVERLDVFYMEGQALITM